MPGSVNYDNIACVYDQRYKRSEYGPVSRLLLDFVSNSSGPVLEVGCGTGHWLEELGHHGYSVVGIDPSAGMLRTVREKVSSVIVVRGCAEALPWRDGIFAHLFCVNAFHHFTDHERFVREARRVMRPEGGIAIIGLNPHTGLDRWWIYEYFPQTVEIDMKRYLSTPSIRKLLALVGFVNCTTAEVLHWPIELPAREALESGRLAKTTTSQLAVLSDTIYETGIRKLVSDIEVAEAKGKVLTIRADLRLFATTAWLQ